MESAGIALIIAGSSLVLTILAQVWGGSWKLSGKLSEMEKGLTGSINKARDEVEEKQQRNVHDFGETISALKEHVREVEMFMRDKYIEKNDFIIQIQHHNEMLTMNFNSITARLDRMEKKLDSKT